MAIVPTDVVNILVSHINMVTGVVEGVAKYMSVLANKIKMVMSQASAVYTIKILHRTSLGCSCLDIYNFMEFVVLFSRTILQMFKIQTIVHTLDQFNQH